MDICMDPICLVYVTRQVIVGDEWDSKVCVGVEEILHVMTPSLLPGEIM